MFSKYYYRLSRNAPAKVHRFRNKQLCIYEVDICALFGFEFFFSFADKGSLCEASYDFIKCSYDLNPKVSSRVFNVLKLSFAPQTPSIIQTARFVSIYREREFPSVSNFHTNRRDDASFGFYAARHRHYY